MTERFPGGEYYGKKLGVDAYSFEDVIRFGDEIYEEMNRQGQSADPLPEGFFDRVVGEHEQLMDIIESLENDQRRVFSMNLPNEGAVPNLPSTAVLELPGIAAAGGIAPMAVRDFPDMLASIISRHLAVIEITVDAALKGDCRLFEEAILMGGYISDRHSVQKMTSDLIAAQKRYLPQFE